MRKRYLFGAGLVVLTILLTLVVWQESFNFGEYAPSNATETFALWAVSTIVLILTVTLGFMLFRTAVKLYLERQSNREGSRIKSKFVFGALALSVLPVAFLFVFSYDILNRNVDKWFSRPTEAIQVQLIDTGNGLRDEIQGRAQALANWLSEVSEVQDGTADYAKLCKDSKILELRVESGRESHTYCAPTKDIPATETFTASADLGLSEKLVVRIVPSIDLVNKQKLIQGYIQDYAQLARNRKYFRNLYLLFLAAIALFILFVATWIALILSRQIITPISALLAAAGQVRAGNLAHRVRVKAMDELATLVRAFNEMTEELESNSRELENRRQFTEAILESIPTGVISLAQDGTIRKVNRALRSLFPEDRVDGALKIADLFPAEEVAEIRYLMKRAQRTGIAASQFDMEQRGQVMHLAVTVSALPASAQGFVVVLEDTSELLRAQKSAAWHEVARRIAHELKNPLTPIALSAERIARQLDRGATPESQRILRECAATIVREVESVKTLADEFSQFSRFPAAQPVSVDLNEIVQNGLNVFAGRLDNIEVRTDFAAGLPPVSVDPEQFKRVVVNLVDNAAEAMRDSHVRRLLVATRLSSPDGVELLVADTGCGISADDKEKLFLPYFSTKGRGTGLGLAIVSHILSEHGARIRVEDNRPTGARFYVEIAAAVPVEVGVRV